MRDFSQIREKLYACEKALIFTHTNMDGDAVGSSAALCLALRKLGKECFILKEDELPGYLSFMVPEGLFADEPPFAQDLSIAVDMGNDARLENRREAFYAPKNSVCIDHHVPPQTPFADARVVDPRCCAASLLVFELLKDMGAEIDKDMADLLYGGIISDTGSFKYDKSGPDAHRAAAELIELGADYEKLSVLLLDNRSLAGIRLEDRAMARAAFVSGGKGIISCVLLSDLEELSARPEDMETVIDRLRSVESAELAAVLKQRGERLCKLSARSKQSCLARALCECFGGGGHDKASGATLEMDPESALAAVSAKAEELFSGSLAASAGERGLT